MHISGYQRIFLILVISLTFSPFYGQPYEIGRMEIEFIDHNRADRRVSALILYPSDSAGFDVPLSRADLNSYPLIVFGHGYLMSVEAYRNIWECIVPEGFVFVLPRSGSGMVPSHLEFGMDMAFLLDEMIRSSSEEASPFSGRLRPSGCLMGHSMGGGAAFVGALYSDAIAATVTLSPLETNPSSAEAARQLSVPSLIFAGSNDCITRPEKHQLPLFDSLQSTQKTYLLIKGGSHCQMASVNKICNVAESICNKEPGISREEQHRVLGRYMLPWLRYYLYGEGNAGNIFEEQLASDTAIICRKVGSMNTSSR